jgi:hypothetical protein
MSDNTPYQAPAPAGNEFQYRTISKAAIASVAFAVLGLSAFIFPAFVLLPVVAIGFGIAAAIEIRKYPEELSGKLASQIGICFGVAIVVGSIATHTYIYYTEVPEGYSRISFADLRLNKRTELPFSEKAREFDGEKVFLKGYVRPGDRRYNLKDFILVGDFGDCCFGGNPDITEIVSVNIQSDDRVDYSLGTRKIGGIFRLNESTRRVNEKDIPQVYYTIEADYIR